MRIRIKDTFPEDHITREAGEKLRRMLIEYSAENQVVEVDFSEVQIASTSFMDEAFAKLAMEGWTESQFSSKVRLENIDPRDAEVLKRVCRYRKLIS